MTRDEFWTAPRGDYASRCRTFLEYAVAANEETGKGALVSQIARLELGRGPIDEDAIRAALAFVDARHDCADFVVACLLRILYQYVNSPLLAPDLLDAIQRTVRGFKYWIVDPGDEMMCFWSENHQLGFWANEYLAGQLYPDAIFANTGETGRWHMARARPKVLRWLDLKARVGFAEWDSNTYHRVNVQNLTNLVDYAADEDVALKAAMLLDLIFFDMAVDSFRGVFGSSHGRSYPPGNTSGRREGTSALQKIAWGMGSFGDPNHDAALGLATSRRYRVARTIEALAQHLPEELENREHQGLAIEEAAAYGLNLSDLDQAMLLWESGKLAAHRIEASLALAERFCSHRFNVVIRPYAEAVLGTYRALAARGTPYDGDLDRTALRPVDKYTYRTPDYQLSCAQDYRKGLPGYQQHIWQATLGPDAIVFSLHRGSASDESYKYWVGRFPRAAQYKNVLVALYDIPAQPLPGPKTVIPPEAGGNAMPSVGPAEEELLPRTVAWFPRDAFDEVVERSGWVMARKGQGYIALRSQQPTQWSAHGVFKGEGLVAEGRRNVWICQMGREAADGPFADWVDRIAAAKVSFGDLAVVYEAPGVGQVRFAWEGPLTVDRRNVPLHGYPRFDNPYCCAPFGSARYEITHGSHRLVLDFAIPRREESGPA